jgi:4'-phosphopantetheinyl transferase
MASKAMTTDEKQHRHCVVCINVSAWDAPAESVGRLMAQLQDAERARCKRFRMDIDKKRSLVGRILLRWMAHVETGQPWGDILLARTKDNKPYLVSPHAQTNFNMNVSHHGDWVAGTSSAGAIVGVDVMRYERPRGCKNVPDFFDTMRQYFTPHEWAYIEEEEEAEEAEEEEEEEAEGDAPRVQGKQRSLSPSTSASATTPRVEDSGGGGGGDDLTPTEFAQLRKFYLHWALKESYIKAIGVGLGFELSRAEFRFCVEGSPVPGDVHLFIDGVQQTLWSFSIHEPDPDHCVVVGLGPFADAMPHFQEVLAPILAPASAEETPSESRRENRVVEFCTRSVQDLKEKENY